VTREKWWSVSTVAMLTLGLTLMIMIPSIGISAETGLSEYANNVSTWISIAPTGPPTGTSSNGLSPSIIQEIQSIKGVNAVYPIASNTTYITFHGNFTIFAFGQNTTYHEFNMGFTSAVLGNKSGFPPSLFTLVSGRLPRPDEAAFVIMGDFKSPDGNPLQLNKTYSIVMPQPQKDNVSFVARLVGIGAQNLLIGSLAILWNPQFLIQTLGKQRFGQTFGGPDFNYVVVKAATVESVEPVVTALNSILKNNAPYEPTWDQAGVLSFESFVNAGDSLYQIVGIASILAAGATTIFIGYLMSNRRSWEVGLLYTQGWDWKGIRAYYFLYFGLLALMSSGIGVVLSLLFSSRITQTFNVYGRTLIVPASPNELLVLSAFPISIFVAYTVSQFVVSSTKHIGLDRALRDY